MQTATLETSKKLQEATDKIQQECHDTLDWLMKERPTGNYQDCTNVFLFKKLAELTLEIEQLKAGEFDPKGLTAEQLKEYREWLTDAISLYESNKAHEYPEKEFAEQALRVLDEITKA